LPATNTAGKPRQGSIEEIEAMDKFLIKGPCELKGEVEISGSKNAALPIITAALLAPGEYTLKNVPNLRDIKTMITILSGLGAVCALKNGTLRINTSRITMHKAPYDLVKTMRASIYVMGPLLAVCGKAEVALPGGCAIGVRPVDLHIHGFRKLGARIDLKGGVISARARHLKGTEIYFEKVSVGATANILMAAVLASGTTRIFNATVDPDILDLVNFLQKMGASIDGAGTNVLTVHGKKRLKPANYSIMPDRIEAGTFLIAAAITGGDVTLKNLRNDHLAGVYAVLEKVGVRCLPRGNSAVTVRGRKRPGTADISTAPFPGFPTDLQPQLTALLALGRGRSVINETVFENRFLHIPELNRMGADIQHDEHLAIINGVPGLTGAPVMASDLRNGSALVLAGLAARGRTLVDRVYHIDRGYESFERKLSGLGADITRIK
jgi:UDP-N-acetylglucosamine 1-carboxyvinyltransferase